MRLSNVAGVELMAEGCLTQLEHFAAPSNLDGNKKPPDTWRVGRLLSH
jgi:hypothetical protein